MRTVPDHHHDPGDDDDMADDIDLHNNPDDCTGDNDCGAEHHVHGCYADNPCAHDEQFQRIAGTVNLVDRVAGVLLDDPSLIGTFVFVIDERRTGTLVVKQAEQPNID